MQHTTFAQALTAELRELSQQSLTPDDVEEALTEAATRIFNERGSPDAFRLTRYVDPEDHGVVTQVEDLRAGEDILLSAAEVTLLRALLMTWDETKPPRAGEPLLVPVKTEDGLQSTYRPEEREE